MLAASGCGGGTTTAIDETVSTEASTTSWATIDVATHVFVMDSRRQRLVAPDGFSFKVAGAVVGEHLHWANWGEATATAIGVFSERRFSTSNRVHFQSMLKLTQLRVCNGAEYYAYASVPIPSSPTKPGVKRLPTPCG